MTRELGFAPHFRGASWLEFRVLLAVSMYVFLIQLSVVLADRMDTTVLGFALPRGVAGPATAIYQVVSKPFAQIRQMGWMLTYLVMPAVASLAAAGDRDDIERLKYDGSRFLIGLLLPIALLAALDAGPFLTLWVGSKYTINARLLRLFLIATAPMGISVLVQMSIGLGRVRFIALAALGGALVNLPLSYILTVRLGGVAGVIWGTVLTTLFSNLLLPGWYTFRTLDVKPATFARRTLAAPFAGAAALVLAALVARWLGFRPDPFDTTADRLAASLPVPVKLARGLPFLFDLSLGSLAYLAGYALAPHGWDDLKALWGKLRRK
jgi:O-antigen/teichoic acid export membrane protein